MRATAGPVRTLRLLLYSAAATRSCYFRLAVNFNMRFLLLVSLLPFVSELQLGGTIAYIPARFRFHEMRHSNLP